MGFEAGFGVKAAVGVAFDWCVFTVVPGITCCKYLGAANVPIMSFRAESWVCFRTNELDRPE